MIDSTHKYLNEVHHILDLLDTTKIDILISTLEYVREQKGRVFCIGVGGGASIASHATNDLRKLCDIETYCPTDNAPELTAITNDNGWEWVFSKYLSESHCSEKDVLFVFSVGGGSYTKKISTNIAYAVDFAKEKGAGVVGIVGPDGGYTAEYADVCVKIPCLNRSNMTAHTEGMQSVILHLIVNALKLKEMKWESLNE